MPASGGGASCVESQAGHRLQAATNAHMVGDPRRTLIPNRATQDARRQTRFRQSRHTPRLAPTPLPSSTPAAGHEGHALARPGARTAPSLGDVCEHAVLLFLQGELAPSHRDARTTRETPRHGTSRALPASRPWPPPRSFARPLKHRPWPFLQSAGRPTAAARRWARRVAMRGPITKHPGAGARPQRRPRTTALKPRPVAPPLRPTAEAPTSASRTATAARAACAVARAIRLVTRTRARAIRASRRTVEMTRTAVPAALVRRPWIRAAARSTASSATTAIPAPTDARTTAIAPPTAAWRGTARTIRRWGIGPAGTASARGNGRRCLRRPPAAFTVARARASLRRPGAVVLDLRTHPLPR